MNKKIDFVVTWVDGTDPNWQAQKASFMSEEDRKMNDWSRYRDWDIFKYWFRSVEQYAPWVNKIFLITEGHLPEWLDENHEKLVVLKHSDYIPSKFLPTFNSNVIELNLHRIEDLSDEFVLFNDDTFINNKVKPEDFFKNNLPVDLGIFSPQVPKRGGIASISLNNIEIINDYFDRHGVVKSHFTKFFRLSYGKHLVKNLVVLPWKPILGFYDHHLPLSYKKSIFKEVWQKEEVALLKTSQNKFRTKNDLNHWLMRYWQLCSGEFNPGTVKFGQTFHISEDIDIILDEISQPNFTLLCLNDGADVDNFEVLKAKLVENFEKRYPIKSGFEL